MRSIALLFSLAILKSCAAEDDYAPFSDALFGLPNEALIGKRQNDDCQQGYNSCSGLGDSAACCPDGASCALDAAGNVACCPSGASCTGVISGTATGTPSTTNPPSGTTSGVVIGATTVGATTTFAPAALPTTGVAGGGTTVPNNFYPFVYIPTSYANPSLCLSAYSYCQSESTACFTSLGGVNGVTVSGFGGGITVQGLSVTTLNPTSASSICSSLSSQACYGISEAQCGTTAPGTTGPTASGTLVQNGKGGPRQTPCPAMVYAAGAGAAVAALGALI